MPVAASADMILWAPQVIAALIALVGVIIGLFTKDIYMAVHLARQKRTEELKDKADERADEHFDLVTAYADPLHDAVTSLYYRLEEIVVKKQARYLRADAPAIPFLEYKKISTLYRIAALLGWIRAIKQERSYIDPRKIERAEADKLIVKIEASLADGGHIELHRLEELLNLWRVTDVPSDKKTRIANKIDGERAEFLAKAGHLSAVDLSEEQKFELSERCAEIVRQIGEVEIPRLAVEANSKQAAVTFGIKEAYIYRDWQAAIGDFMIKEIDGGLRRYTVMGYGDFEEHYINAYKEDSTTRIRRWFNRLHAIVYDLDMEKAGIFDAKRDQLIKLHAGCAELKSSLEQHIRELGRQSA